jgi:putative tryptophan/tyrosine transport system substrate-binding protein
MSDGFHPAVRRIVSEMCRVRTRREVFIAMGVSAIAGPFSAVAQLQSEKMLRIGFLTRTSAATLSPLLDSFRQALRDLGWVEGKSISIEYQFGDGDLNRLGELASELVRHKVDVIVTVDTPPTQAAKHATSTIPIVIAVSADPVGAGLVASLARPGGNITGLSLLAPETDQKNLEILKETLPKAKRVAMIWDPNNRGMTLRFIAIQAAAGTLDMTIQSIAAPGPDELAGGLTAMAKNPPDALIVLAPIYAAHRNAIVNFTTKTGVPLTFDTKNLAGEPGALLSYGADLTLLFQRAATYVDKILKGAKPADLPVEQPTKFELVINLKTAKALGLTVPQSILARADEVIE